MGPLLASAAMGSVSLCPHPGPGSHHGSKPGFPPPCSGTRVGLLWRLSYRENPHCPSLGPVAARAGGGTEPTELAARAPWFLVPGQPPPQLRSQGRGSGPGLRLHCAHPWGLRGDGCLQPKLMGPYNFPPWLREDAPPSLVSTCLSRLQKENNLLGPDISQQENWVCRTHVDCMLSRQSHGDWCKADC